MDNLLGLRRGVANAEKDSILPIRKMVGPLAKAPFVPSLSSASNSRGPHGSGVQMTHLVLAVIMAFLSGMAVVGVVMVEGGWVGSSGAGLHGMK
jgi:hypothetical protein